MEHIVINTVVVEVPQQRGSVSDLLQEFKPALARIVTQKEIPGLLAASVEKSDDWDLEFVLKISVQNRAETENVISHVMSEISRKLGFRIVDEVEIPESPSALDFQFLLSGLHPAQAL